MQPGIPLMKDAAPSPCACGNKSTQDRTDHAYITILTNANGRLGKEFHWVNGSIQTLSNATLYKGHAETVIADTAEQLAGILDRLPHNQAIALGVLDQGGPIPLASKALAGPNDITRSKDYFKYPHGPGWLLFDVDDLPDHIKDRADKLGGPLAAIELILPELITTEYVVRPSSSGGIVSPDGIRSTSGKLHIYVRVSDVSQSKAILIALHQRAWTMGFGFIKLSESGSRLERSLFDTAVASPERLVYEAPPIVHSPLKREVVPTTWTAGDTLEIPEAPDQDAFHALVNEAVEKVRPESLKTKKQYTDRHVKRVAKETGVSEREARRIVKQRMNGGILADDDVIDGPDGKPLRAGDLLDQNPERMPLPCPSAGYSYGTANATFLGSNLEYPEPKLVSHAHGQKTVFRFARFERSSLECPPPHALPTLSADDASREVKDAISAFVEETAFVNKLQIAEGGKYKRSLNGLIKASLGVGKTHSLTVVLKKVVANNSNFRTLICVPTHKLARQTAAMLNDGGDTAVIWRGLEADDPNTTELQMCRRQEDVQAARSMGASLEHVCGSLKSGYCPHNPVQKICASPCGYRSQDARNAPVVIVAGAMSLTIAPPIRIRRTENDGGAFPDFDLVVVDETSPTEWLAGGDGKINVGFDVLTLNLRQLALAADASVSIKITEEEETELSQGLATLHRFLCGLADNEIITRRNLYNAGLDERCLARLKALAWKFVPEIDETQKLSAMNSYQIRTQLAAHGVCFQTVESVAKLLSALEEGLMQRNPINESDEPIEQVRLRTVLSQNGPRKMANLLRRLEIHGKYRKVPTLVLDATGNLELLKLRFGGIECLADVTAKDGEGVTRIQLVDKRLSYAQFVPGASGGDLNTQKRNTQQIARLALLRSRQFPDVAVICPKAVEEHIETEYPSLYGTSQWGHFGGIRGQNSLEGVDALTVVGRLAAPAAQLERMAAVLSGKKITRIKPDKHGRRLYEQTESSLLMRDGSGRRVTAESHPDPIVGALRPSITEAELEQACGRSRAVRRAKKTPLIETIVTSVPTSFAVDEIFTWAELKAATGWPVLLLLAGVWPLDGKCSQLQAAALRAIKARPELLMHPPLGETCHPQVGEPLLEDYIGDLRLEGTRGATDWINAQRRDNPEIDRIIERIDQAYAAARPSVEILYADFPLTNFHLLKIRQPGARYSVSVMLRGATVEEAAERGKSLFSEADILST